MIKSIYFNFFSLFAKGIYAFCLNSIIKYQRYEILNVIYLVQFSRVQLCNPMDYGMPGFAVYHQFLEFTQTHVHWVSDATQLSHPLSSPSPSAFNLSQHKSFFKRVSSSHQVAKVLEFQLQHQSFQWIFRTNIL